MIWRKKFFKINLVRKISSKLKDYIDRSLDSSLDPDKFKEKFQKYVRNIYRCSGLQYS